MSKETCCDCGETKTGCKIITKITAKLWTKTQKDKDKAEAKYLGKPVCRACLNFSDKMVNDFGEDAGFYKAD